MIIRACRQRGCRSDANAGRRGYCARHARSTAARGYDRDHMAARDQLARTLPAPCAYGCGTILRPGDRWVAAHVVDGDRTAGRVAACLGCNQRAKGDALRPIATAVVV